MNVHDDLTAVAWQRRLAMGARHLDVGFGAAMVTADLPFVFDQNVVWAQREDDPQRVLQATEDLAADAGWRHRTIEVSVPVLADHLRPTLTAVGYDEVRHVTMLFSGQPPAPDDPTVTAVVSVAEQQSLARALVAEEPWATTDAIVNQFGERERRLAHVTGAKAVVAPAPAPVSRALVLFDDGFCEIDAVMTLSQHRGHGWSAAVMQRSLHVGRETGRPIVLVADHTDWPLRWYQRLGFRSVGVLSVFRRWPDAS